MNVMGGTILEILNSKVLQLTKNRVTSITMDYSQDDYYNLSNNFKEFQNLCSGYVYLKRLRLTIIDPLKPELLHLINEGGLPSLEALSLTFESVHSR